jgi:general secretion pathway protein M
MSAWWRSLSARERILILGAATVLGMITLFLGVLEPLHAEQQRLQTQVTTEQQILQELQGLAMQAASLRGAQPGTEEPPSEGTFLSVLNTAAAEYQLDSHIKRVVPNGDREATVALNEVVFDRLIEWVLALRERHGIEIARFVIDKTGDAGEVNANLTLSSAR